jgi:response regulator RpfG family c-di-GMP phosphodiesterase
METRSKETANHVQQVSQYIYLHALKAGLSEEEATILKVVATIHDIGKIAIPESILNKPGVLTAE